MQPLRRCSNRWGTCKARFTICDNCRRGERFLTFQLSKLLHSTDFLYVPSFLFNYVYSSQKLTFDIPCSEMLRIMKEYGSEVSNQTLPTRKTEIKKTSVIRQFRRWNPDFFRYFQQDADGKWQPRLGKDGELKRRAEKRMSVKAEKREAALASAPSL